MACTVRCRSLLHQPTGSRPRWRRPRLLCFRSPPAAADFPASTCLLRSCRPREMVPVARVASAESPPAEVLLSETFRLKRIQTVEGKVSVRMDQNLKETSTRRVVIMCNLEGQWVLHWGVTYSEELWSEWDQPPPDMRPPGSVPIKDYAIETPLKKCQSFVEGEPLFEVVIDTDCRSSVAAIHFVLKEEETGAWIQHRGRDFRIPMIYCEEEENSLERKESFSIWPGPHTGDQQIGRGIQNDNCFYEEYPIVKEEVTQNCLNVTVRRASEANEKLIQFDIDIPGNIVVHWGVCNDHKRKWEIPPFPYPPQTKIFRQKALQTALQTKSNCIGNCGSFAVNSKFSGLLFVLKINDYIWLNNMGTDFYIPLTSERSLPSHRDQKEFRQTEMQEVTEGASNPKGNSEKADKPGLMDDHAAYTDQIINEIRNMVTDISSGKGRQTKTKEAQGNILHEIEKLAVEAYSIFRSSTSSAGESNSENDLETNAGFSSSTGSGYEILCQGFNWESHKSGRWYIELGEKAKELASLGFTIVWLPPPTESVSPEGYMPRDLYNLNSRYGNMKELKELVRSFHEAGVKVLGDVVLNHRCAHYQNSKGIWSAFGGRLSWDDKAIVSDDPHFEGKGNKGSGEFFHAAPNIDHSQDFVRKDLTEWLHWLRREVGYDGWRLDFVRGFWGGYVKDYLKATEPYFAVGEYWDSLNYTYEEMDYNQDAHRQRIINWINATSGTAGAFDVTTKGILHTALERCEYWRLSDEAGKAPGVLGWWPSRAVTFIENHDTGSTQNHWRFPRGKEMQGYAYILTHPGTPTVFYDHIFSPYYEEIARLISTRHRAKLHCRSLVKIVKAEKDVYAAEIDEKVLVKIGPGNYEPPADTKNWTSVAEGNEYKVWEAS